MQAETAHVVALQALAWLAGDPDRLGQFLAATGSDAAGLRALATQPEFLAAVLDHLLQDDQWITGFCDSHALPYDTPLQARARLPGGDITHWT